VSESVHRLVLIAAVLALPVCPFVWGRTDNGLVMLSWFVLVPAVTYAFGWALFRAIATRKNVAFALCLIIVIAVSAWFSFGRAFVWGRALRFAEIESDLTLIVDAYQQLPPQHSLSHRLDPVVLPPELGTEDYAAWGRRGEDGSVYIEIATGRYFTNQFSGFSYYSAPDSDASHLLQTRWPRRFRVSESWFHVMGQPQIDTP
jgi:hypothetical protein